MEREGGKLLLLLPGNKVFITDLMGSLEEQVCRTLLHVLINEVWGKKKKKAKKPLHYNNAQVFLGEFSMGMLAK